ncbi:hypothetical protein GGR51DRAFT_529207 [Nemania sp. FL0031]|nr:hypothetical protein GGR51DRAFT_529207 [Nemania sp. FL0031]
MAEQEQKPLMKMTVLHYRNPSRDEKTWTEWYLKEHVPRFVPIVHKHGIDRFELYMTPSEFKEQFKTDLEKYKGGSSEGWNMAPYDAATIYWVTDPQKVRNMLSDPDWNNKVIAFEKDWIDQSRADVQLGFQTTFIEGGKIVNTATKEYDTPVNQS